MSHQFSSPQNAQELFNLRHATARNVVERIFGVLKRRWAVLCHPVKYGMDVQARIPAALIALHNLILDFDPFEHIEALADENEDEYLDPMPRTENDGLGELSTDMIVPDEEQEEAERRRDHIANAMWEQYLEYIGNN